MKTEKGWLIETNINGYAEWLMLDSPMYVRWEWTQDASEALRFARKIDVEIMMKKLRTLGVISFYEDVFPSEHTWYQDKTGEYKQK